MADKMNVSYLLFIAILSYDHPHILAGAGTMGLEIVDQVPDLDACIIPIGGGGLIAGCAVAMKFFVPTCKIYASRYFLSYTMPALFYNSF